MKESPGELRQRIEMLEERISNLCAAVLRVSASLDLETVLREIVDSACALTGARYGLVVIVDDAGQPQDFVTAGLERRNSTPGNGRVARRTAALRALPGPAGALADRPTCRPMSGSSASRRS